jgi:diguanylate cyclase (GGDEF)-like protein
MFDIDHFKKVNDTYGHQAGDEVIRATSRTLKQCMRTTDIAGRYGGEEFAVILIDTTADGATTFAERLRTSIESQPVVHDGKKINYTISLGLAEFRDRMQRSSPVPGQGGRPKPDRRLYRGSEDSVLSGETFQRTSLSSASIMLCACDR